MANEFEKEITIRVDKAIQDLEKLNKSIDKLSKNFANASGKSRETGKAVTDAIGKPLKDNTTILNEWELKIKSGTEYLNRFRQQVLEARRAQSTFNSVIDAKEFKSYLATITSGVKVKQEDIAIQRELNSLVLDKKINETKQNEIAKNEIIIRQLENIVGINEQARDIRNEVIAAIKAENRELAKVPKVKVQESKPVITDAPLTQERVKEIRQLLDTTQALTKEQQEQVRLRAQLNSSYVDPRLNKTQVERLEIIKQQIIQLEKLKSTDQRVISARDTLIAKLKAEKNELSKYKDSIDQVTISWASFQRLVIARVVTQIFYNLTSAITSTIATADDLLIRLGEIQTLVLAVDQNSVGLEVTMASIYDISSKLNFDSIDVAAAYYEALSNQVGDTNYELKIFLDQAGKLAKTTRSTLEESSDAIASVMNSYGLTIEDVDEISSTFFVLVDKGRVKLEEIADTIGNVSVPAAQLGVSFEEVAAALATISIEGVNAKESQTLLRNVMFKLIRPTDTMKELFQEWGVASGEAAIATYGFQGVLALLDKEAEKGSERLGDLFGRIRALRGIMGLTKESFDKFNETFEELKNAQDQYAKAQELVFKNAGEITSKRLRQVQNEVQLTAVRLQQLLAFFLDSDKAFSVGLEVGKTVAAFAAIGAAASSVHFFVSQARGAIHNMTSLSQSSTLLKFLNPNVFAAVTGAVTGLALAYAYLYRSAAETIAAIENKNAELVRDFKKNFTDKLLVEIEATALKIKEEFREALESIAGGVKGIQDEINKLEAEKANFTFIDDIKTALDALNGDTLVSGVNGSAAYLYNEFKINVEDTTDALKDQKDVLEDINKELQQQYDESLKITNQAKNQARTNRIDRQLQFYNDVEKANAQVNISGGFLGEAFNAKNIEDARDAIKEARKYLNDAERGAFATGALGTPERHLAFFEERFAQIDAAEQQIEKQYRRELENQAAQNQQKIGLFDQEISKREAIKTAIENEIKAYEFYEDKVTKILKNDNIELEKKLKLLDQIAQSATDSKLLGEESQSQLNRQADIVAKQLELQETKNAQENLIEAQNTFNDAVRLQKDLASTLKEESQQTLQDIRNLIDILKNANKELQPRAIGPGGGPQLTEEEFKNSRERSTIIRDLESALPTSEDQATFNAELRNFLNILNETPNLSDKFKLPEKFQAQIEAYRAELTPLTDIITIHAEQYDRITKSLDDQIIKARELFQIERDRAAAVAATGVPQVGVQQAAGGPAGYGPIGGPRGTDIIPAWLSPGEYVINAKSAARNFALLTAINHGQRFAKGGPVTQSQTFNNTFHVQSNNPTHDVNKIAKAISRQVRQGKVSFTRGRPI